MDEDGYTYIVQRKKDMIIVSGFNVYPSEVEGVLYTHPAVMEAAVIGVPDTYRGEAVKACVVLKSGATATSEELKRALRERAGGVQSAERDRDSREPAKDRPSGRFSTACCAKRIRRSVKDANRTYRTYVTYRPYTTMQLLEDKVAIITGAARGIGRALRSSFSPRTAHASCSRTLTRS